MTITRFYCTSALTKLAADAFIQGARWAADKACPAFEVQVIDDRDLNGNRKLWQIYALEHYVYCGRAFTVDRDAEGEPVSMTPVVGDRYQMSKLSTDALAEFRANPCVSVDMSVFRERGEPLTDPETAQERVGDVVSAIMAVADQVKP